MTVLRHLEDAAAVARLLWDEWLPDAVRRRIGEVASSDPGRQDPSGRALLMWLAGTHDAGKMSPAFVERLSAGTGHAFVDLPGETTRLGFHMSSLTKDAKASARHAIVGQVAIERWLTARFGDGWDRPRRRRAQRLAAIAGAHHGFPADNHAFLAASNSDGLGDETWGAARQELLDHMAAATGADDHLDEWLSRDWPVGVQALLVGLVVLCDWLASDSDVFPYRDGRSSDERARAALARFRLPSPWRPSTVTDAVRLFRERFPSVQADPNTFQQAVTALAAEVSRPPLLIIEAPTGSGKTEAALMAAEVLAAKYGSGGVFVGLPTMATSNSMFGRVLDWMEAGAVPELGSVYLAHSKAELNGDFADLRARGRPRAVYDDDLPAGGRPDASRDYVHARVASWLTGRRKGVLASFVVGTVDQALVAATRSKHVALRHTGLAGKVVIIDEVHAADRVMRIYLRALLAWLGHHEVPTILMSATLPRTIIEELGGAYERGARPRVGENPVGPRELEPAYPRAVCWDGQWRQLSTPSDPARSLTVGVQPLVRSVPDELRERLGDGGVAFVVRNTVKRAQDTYQELREEYGDEVVLLHSRLIARDRLDRENDLMGLLGPRADRPHRLVVVATQVIEQSLDIDADVMISDLAPVDLLVQRLGRLHRHRHRDPGRPARLREPELLVDAVEGWDSDAPCLEGGGVKVYGNAPLLESLAVLRGPLAGARVEIPADVPGMVHAAYVEPDIPEAWRPLWERGRAADARKDAEAKSRADSYRLPDPWFESDLRTWGQSTEPDDDAILSASVRDGEDSFEVVVIREVGPRIEPLAHLDDLAGREIPFDSPPDPDIAAALAECTLRLPSWLSRDAVLEELERDALPGWQQSPYLVGQLVLRLDEHGRTTLAGQELHYAPDLGLTITRVAKERSAGERG